MDAMKILVVDDHSMYIEGLRFAFESSLANCEVQGACTAEQAVHCYSRCGGFDLVLLDIHLADLTGMVVFDLLQGVRANVPVAFLSGYASHEEVRDAVRRGAKGFIDKRETPQRICEAVQQLASGLSYFSPGIPQDACSTTENAPKLTSRQADILVLMAEGLLNKQIADKLGCAENTVKVHIRALYRTLNTHTRTACIRKAQRFGLLHLTF